MKPITQYKCEVCGTLYNSEEKCLECENQHKIPKKIIKSVYRSRNSYEGFPEFIYINFEDKYEKKYKIEW